MSYPLLVVGLVGRARHGKDDVAAILTERLKESNLTVFPCSVSLVIHKRAVQEKIIKSEKRELCTEEEIQKLVNLGNWGRSIDSDFWINKLDELIYEESVKAVIITGIRFPSEEHWLRELPEGGNGLLVRVTRLNADGSEFISPDRDPNDETETSQYRLNADFEIVAKTGQNDWLNAQANALAAHLLKEATK